MNQMNWLPQVPPPSVPSVPPPMPVAFSGRRGEFFDLVRRGAGLEFVTLGFYRFWLLTDMRRHLWANTLVDGDAAEYTGRARELLIGFLVALAILLPVYLGYFLVGLEAEHIQAFASIPLVAFFYVFGQFAIYRARRYRLTRTVWRGVRFWMSGSGWMYALQASLWGLLVVSTLGLALPWRTAALERYKMRHSFYGEVQGGFEGRGWEFFKRGWWLWLLAPVAMYVFPLAPFVYGACKAVEWRWWLSGVRLGGVRVESSLPRGALIGLYWKVIGWVFVLALVFAAYLALSAALVASMTGAPMADFFRSQEFAKSIPLLALAGVGYLAFVLAVNVVIRVYLLRDLWVRVLGSVNITGIEAVRNVAARGELAGALGEGFADGLDVGGL
jgi:uncharacterized membrane protein YjgN (DUF898 family)